MEDTRSCDKYINYCHVCVPYLQESLADSNIGTRCTAKTDTGRIEHLGKHIMRFPTKFLNFKWENKVKLSNYDRRALLEEIKKNG